MSFWLLLIAAVSAFAVGGIWYGPLFGKVWALENGFPEGYQPGPPARVFGVSFIFTFFAAAGYLHLVGFTDDVLASASHGAAVGALVAATSFGINYQFCGKSFKLLLIDGGYHTVQFAVIGALYAGLHELI
jgi:hypothetical protein